MKLNYAINLRLNRTRFKVVVSTQEVPISRKKLSLQIRIITIGLTLGLLLMCLSAVRVTGKPRSADEIIHKYIRARGGYKKLKAIKTLRMTGTYQEGKNTFGTYIESKR